MENNQSRRRDDMLSPYRKTQEIKGKMQFNVAKKGFTLYRRNEFGISDLNRVVVKSTSLHREVELLVVSRIVGTEFRFLKEKGMLSWPAYKENRPSIKRALDALRGALIRFRERRLQNGYFYLVPARQHYGISVHSPLFTMPRKDAMKKIKLLREKRQAVSSSSNASPNAQESDSSRKVVSERSTSRHIHKVLQMMIYGCVIGLACIIIYV